MSELIGRKLAELVAQDPSIGDDPRRCEALLRDLCRNQHKKEILALVTAIRERVVAEIRTGGGYALPHTLMGRLLQRLHDDCGLREDVSRWTIETWAAAYWRPLESAEPPATERDLPVLTSVGGIEDVPPGAAPPDAKFDWNFERNVWLKGG